MSNIYATGKKEIQENLFHDLEEFVDNYVIDNEQYCVKDTEGAEGCTHCIAFDLLKRIHKVQ